MGKKLYNITAADSKALRERMSEVKNKHAYRRLLIVALKGEGHNDIEIAKIVQTHPDNVRKMTKRYALEGMEELAQERRKGGNNRNLSQADEEAFLAKFEKAAEKGQIVTTGDIAQAYDEFTGKNHASKSTVYKLLHRSGWRKVMPRSKHPGKASDEAIEASKKLKINSEN